MRLLGKAAWGVVAFLYLPWLLWPYLADPSCWLGQPPFDPAYYLPLAVLVWAWTAGGREEETPGRVVDGIGVHVRRVVLQHDVDAVVAARARTESAEEMPETVAARSMPEAPEPAPVQQRHEVLETLAAELLNVEGPARDCDGLEPENECERDR